eukprot:11182221-Lingulodinium_polyedra.AAC.1
MAWPGVAAWHDTRQDTTRAWGGVEWRGATRHGKPRRGATWFGGLRTPTAKTHTTPAAFRH